MKNLYYSLLYKYLRHYNLYNFIIYLVMLIIINILGKGNTVECMMVEVAPHELPGPQGPGPQGPGPSLEPLLELREHYQTYEAFKDYMNANIINNTEFMLNVEPLAVTYLRTILYTIEGLAYLYEVPYSKYTDELLYADIVIHISRLVYTQSLQFPGFDMQNLVINLARLNTELKNPLLYVIIEHQTYLDNVDNPLFRGSRVFDVNMSRAIEQLQLFYRKTPIRTQEFINPLLNEFLKEPVSRLDSIPIPIDIDINKPLKLPDINDILVDDLAQHFIRHVERDVRLTSSAVGYQEVSDLLLKRIIFNQMLHNYTDCVFWTQYPTLRDVDTFIFHINMSRYLERQIMLHHNEDFLTNRTFLMLYEIFDEISDYNIKHGTDLTMGQIIDIISSRL